MNKYIKIDHICSCGGFGSQMNIILSWFYVGNGNLKVNLKNRCKLNCPWSKINKRYNILEEIFEEIIYEDRESVDLPISICSVNHTKIKNSICYFPHNIDPYGSNKLATQRYMDFKSNNFMIFESFPVQVIIDTSNKLNYIYRKRLSEVFHKYFKPKKHILNKINKYLELFKNNNVVGLHIRSSQHYTKLGDNNVRTKDIVCSICTQIVKMKNKNIINKNSKFFIATHNINILKKIKKMLGEENLIFIDTYRDDNTIYENSRETFNKNDWSRETGNINDYGELKYSIDVFIDIFLLSKCNLLLGGYSNVTANALIMNPELNFITPDILKDTGSR